MTDSGKQVCDRCGATLQRAGASCAACLLELGIDTPLENALSPDSTDRVSPPASHAADATPRQIGPYSVIGVLGRGGMGTVYRAEQTAPIQRQVAIKIMRRGLETSKGIARFEAERQALALMDHPAIAKIFDAGETEDGRLYLVMELVEGQPIHSFCDEGNLPTHKRLELFVKVCEGVQHAHRKGVIHRDLKPSNVLVRVEQGEAIPVIIDFGVAKIVEPSFDSDSTVTEMDRVVGTPKYMSPEQIELSPLGIDTRSDVYALGVLLYELLTGTHPYDSEQMRSASFDEVRRIIREEHPSVPSDRFRHSNEGSADAASRRSLDVPTLRRKLQGDLDWIVLRALEKEPSRRYSTPTELAADVERHLKHEPVEARPPSAYYRFSKLVRRHRIAALGVLAVLLALMLGTVISTRFALAESRERRAAESAREDLEIVSKFQARMLRQINLAQMGETLIETFDADNPTNTARSIVDREILLVAAENIEDEFSDRPEIAASLLSSLAETYKDLGLYDQAALHLDDAIKKREQLLGADDAQTLDLICQRGGLARQDGRWDESAADFERCREGRRRIFGAGHEKTLYAEAWYCGVFGEASREQEASACFEEILPTARRLAGDQAPATINLLSGYCQSLNDRDLADQAASVCAEAAESSAAILGEDDPATLTALGRLAATYFNRGDFVRAAEAQLKLYQARRRVLGDSHLHTLLSLTGVAVYTSQAGNPEQAIERQQVVIDRMTETLGANHHSTWIAYNFMGRHLEAAGRSADAVDAFRTAHEGLGALHGERNTDTLVTGYRWGSALLQDDKPQEAEAVLSKIVARFDEERPQQGRMLAMVQTEWAASLTALGRYSDSERVLRESVSLSEGQPERARMYKSAVERFIELYEAQGKSEQASSWQQRLDALEP